ncbi:MAG: GAF domain-containing protein [Candidatus Methylomirabilia bacterium]
MPNTWSGRWLRVFLIANRFVVLSFLCILALAVGMGFTLSHLLTAAVSEWDWENTAAFAQRQIELVGLDALFTAPQTPETRARWGKDMSRLFRGLPEIVRVKVWDREATILWSDEPRLIGQRFPHNQEIRASLAGKVAVEIKRLTKAEHAYEEEQFASLAEVYVPIFSKQSGAVVGVVELYKTPNRLFATIRWGRIVIWTISLTGGLSLYLVLLPLVRQVYGREVREETLRTHAGRIEQEAAERTRELQSRTDQLVLSYEQTERRRREAASLAEVGRLISESLNPAQVARRIVDSLSRLFTGGPSALHRLDPESGDLITMGVSRDVGPGVSPNMVVPRGSGAAGLAVRERRPVVTPDVLSDPRITFPPEVRSRVEQAPYRSVLAVPLLVHDRVIGTLAVGSWAGRVFTNEEIQLAEAFADQAALALENARLYAEADRRRREAELLAELGRSINTSLDLDMVFQRVVEGAKELCGSDIAHITLEEPDSAAMVPRYRVEARAEGDDTSHIVEHGNGMGGQVPVRVEGIIAQMTVPIRSEGRVEGLLYVSNRSPRPFTDRDEAILAQLADHAAIAVQNARLFEQSEASRRAAEALLNIAQVLGSTLELRQVLKIIALRTAEAVGGERCSINLWREGHVVPVMSQFADGRADPDLWAKFKAMGPYRLEEVPAHAEAMRTKRPIAIEDVTGSTMLPAYWAEAFDIRSVLVVPLIHQDEAIGSLNIDRTKAPHVWRQEQIDLAMTIASQAALALEKARLYEEAERRRQEAEELALVAQTLTESLDIAAVGERIVNSVLALFGMQGSFLWRLQPDGSLVISALAGPTEEHFELGYVLPPGMGVAGRAVTEGRPAQVQDVQSAPEVFVSEDLYRRNVSAGIRAILVVPLRVKGEVIGGLAVVSQSQRAFSETEVQLLQAFADQAALAVENARLYEEIRGARDFLQSIAENSADVIATSDIHGRLTYLSPTTEEIFGYPPEEMLGRPMADFYRGGLEEARAVMRRLRAEGRIRNYETASWAKDGRRVEVSMSLSLLRDPTGTVTGLVGITRDITERKQIEKELIRSERVWAVGEMAAGVAHNFNNLLAVVLGRAQFVLLQMEEQKLQLGDVQRNLAVIERAALNGAATVRRLLEFTRDTPRAGVAVTVDVGELLTHTLELARHRWKDEAEAQGREIQVVLEPGPVPPAAGNPAELQEVLLCLILNAIDAMPQGGTLTLSSWAEDGSVCLAVKDTGIGIPEEVQSRIFEPFFTTKGPQATGLGLSASHGIIRRHEGEIVVNSREGHGTTFTIKLPAGAAPAPRVDRTAAITPQGGRLRILIIDDEPEVRAIFRDIAEAAGHEVREAESGAEGLETLERQPVDLVCTDLGMPGMAGWQVADRVKARWPELPVALITGWGARVAPEELGAHGVDLLITKPFQAKALLHALADFRPLEDSTAAS